MKVYSYHSDCQRAGIELEWKKMENFNRNHWREQYNGI